MDHEDKPADGDLMHDDALDATLAKTEASSKDAASGAAVGSGVGAGDADTSDDHAADGDPITTEHR